MKLRLRLVIGLNCMIALILGGLLFYFQIRNFPVLTWANVWEPLLCGFGVSIVVWAFLFLFEFMMLCMYLLRLFFQTLE